MISTFLKTEKVWLMSHLVWVVAVLVAYVGFTNWKFEHDNAAAKNAQVQIAQATIAQLNAQIAATDKATAAKVITITKIVHDSRTPPQVVAAIPTLTNIPLNARTIPGDPVDVAVAAIPLIDLVGQFSVAQTNLTACQTDLGNEKAIASQQADEIKVLKKKPPLGKRLTHALKIGGIVFGIGVIFGAHFL